MEKWAYFTIRQKSWNSMPFLLIIGRASKQYKRMPQKVFHQNTKVFGGFLAWFVCVLLRTLPKFPVDPYYEPLAWFMIILANHYTCYRWFKCSSTLWCTHYFSSFGVVIILTCNWLPNHLARWPTFRGTVPS